MDAFSILQSIAEATQETTSRVPLDTNLNCPFCTCMSYETIKEFEDRIDEVKCVKCQGRFFVDYNKNLDVCF